MPLCLDVMHQYGNYPDGQDIQSMALPDTLVDICEGDFLSSDTANSLLVADLVSDDITWNASLTQTQQDAAAAFKGVALGQISATDGTCNDRPDCIPIARYRVGSKFTRAYKIVGTDGVATPTTWVRGQGFTFGKDPDNNLLTDNTIQLSTTSADIVFRAVKDSGPTAQAYAEVEFGDS